MSHRGALVRLSVAVFCAVAVAACGQSSTEQLSPDAVADKVKRIAGPDGHVYYQQPTLIPADGGEPTELLVFVACPAAGDCTLVGRDGATYPDVQTFVDESPDVKPGDEVLANADLMHPKVGPGDTRGIRQE